jgi:putative transposase
MVMKKIRLEKEVYSQRGYPCHITIDSAYHKNILGDDRLTRQSMRLLEQLCLDYKLTLYVYCFMPDHIHFVVSVKGDKSIIELVQAFKSKTTIGSYNFGFSGQIFQTRFFDHFIRTYQNLENEIRYILENPVRKGLVDDYSKYPYSKSLIDKLDL